MSAKGVMMQEYAHVGERIEEILHGIASAAKRTGRDPAGIALLAVTKYHPAEAVRAAYASGIRRFGENRVQEADSKYRLLFPELQGAELHMIGTLQSNKVNRAVELFTAIQSLHSEDMVRRILERFDGGPRFPVLYLEIHTGEDSKYGFADDDSVFRACEMIARSGAAAKLKGLMTMAPFTAEESLVRASFSRVRKLRDAIASRFSFEDFRELSMGMSGDYAVAVEEGSTMVRIGTAIFGERG